MALYGEGLDLLARGRAERGQTNELSGRGGGGKGFRVGDIDAVVERGQLATMYMYV